MSRHPLVLRARRVLAILGLAPFRLVVRALALVTRRDEAVWVFGSWHGHRYADNSRALFDHLSGDDSGIRPVWLSRDQSIVDEVRALGYRAHRINSWAGFRIAMGAGVFAVDCGVDDIPAARMGRARLVNLWHGVPLKRLAPADGPNPWTQHRRGDSLKSLLLGPTGFGFDRADLFLCTNELMSTRIQQAFGFAPDQIVLAAYPRNQHLTGQWTAPALTASERSLADVLDGDHAAGTVRILYAPTFRDGDLGTHPSSYLGSGIDAVLEDCGAVLYVKSHSAVNSDPAGSTGTRVRSMAGPTDLHPLLGKFDILITDYSSIYLDYLLLDRPTVFFPHDLGAYSREIRGLYDDYDEATPGPKAYTPEELADVLRDMLKDLPAHTAQWAARRADVVARHQVDRPDPSTTIRDRLS